MIWSATSMRVTPGGSDACDGRSSKVKAIAGAGSPAAALGGWGLAFEPNSASGIASAIA